MNFKANHEGETMKKVISKRINDVIKWSIPGLTDLNEIIQTRGADCYPLGSGGTPVFPCLPLGNSNIAGCAVGNSGAPISGE